MLEIKIFGSCCCNSDKLEQMVFNVCAEQDIDADIIKINDSSEFEKYGVSMAPGLVINGKVRLQGKLPTKSTLEHWLRDAAAQMKIS